MVNISKLRKYHFLYKTTNLVNGKYYYGMHSTNNLKDGYLGSGKYLWYAIKKYGKENFYIEILKFFETREALIEAEKKLVTVVEVNNSNCMNLKPGGKGGFKDSKHREAFVNSIPVDKKREYAFKRHKQGVFGFKGKNHKPETIEKMKLHKGKQAKEKNSQFGTKWITNEIENKKIKVTDQIPEGWRAGRKIKLDFKQEVRIIIAT